MGIGKTSAEQEAEYAERQRQLAEERVERREKMGQKPQSEPLLGGTPSEDSEG